MWAAWTILARNLPGKKDFFLFVCPLQCRALRKRKYFIGLQWNANCCTAMQCSVGKYKDNSGGWAYRWYHRRE